MQRLTVTQEVFLAMISGLIKSGVTFHANVAKNTGFIHIDFQGGY